MSDNILPSVLVNSKIQPAVLEKKICSEFRRGIDGASLQSLVQLVRPIIKKEVEQQQLKYLNINGKCCYSCAGSSSGAGSSSFEPIRYLELRFSCNVSETVWTAEFIRGEGNSSILVTLFDVHTGQAVTSGPEASAKLEIVILKGSFDRDDWTAEEFSQNIIEEMNGNKILKGNVLLELKDGTGALGDLWILHDKNWKPVSKLRLGARVVDSFQDIRVIKEAKTQTFTMKDKRMKENRKGVQVLSVMDNVGRLKNIGQRGPIAKRLRERGIQTIKDFLNLNCARLDELRRILGRWWGDAKMKATIDHARKCKGSTAVVLKCDAHKLVDYGFDDNEEEGFVWYNTLPPIVSPATTTSTAGCASNGPFSSSIPMMCYEDVVAEPSVGNASSIFDNDLDGSTIMSNKNNSAAMAESSINASKMLSSPQMVGGYDCPQQPSLFSPDIMPSFFPLTDFSFLDEMELQYYNEILSFQDQAGIALPFCENEHLQYLNSNSNSTLQAQSQSSISESQTDLHNAVNSFLQPPSTAFAQRRWKMLFSVLRWFSVRRLVMRGGKMEEKLRC